MQKIFCDTSYFYAALVPSDVNHQAARELTKWAADNRIDFYVTWDIISETATLLLKRCGFRVALYFLEELKPALNVVTYDGTIRELAETTFK
jgi:predicted nucleic acid-binding protein